VRQLKRSKKRLKELAKVDVNKLDEKQREKHVKKVAKHQEGVALCEASNRTNVVVTNELAGLLKFPDGAAAPGHRVTVVAAGIAERLIVGLLVDAASCDYGKLQPAVEDARERLTRVGIPSDQQLRILADAGYRSEADLVFAMENRAAYDILIPDKSAAQKERPSPRKGMFGRDHFQIDDKNNMTCPAGRLMAGPFPQSKKRPRLRYEGIGCSDCALKPKCTKTKRRALTLSAGLDIARRHMQARMAEPGAAEIYNKRMATIEPVFSLLESVMGFRRATTRKGDNVKAEIALHALALNIRRLATRKPVQLFFVLFV
jgi:Transposase DDE domain